MNEEQLQLNTDNLEQASYEEKRKWLDLALTFELGPMYYDSLKNMHWLALLCISMFQDYKADPTDPNHTNAYAKNKIRVVAEKLTTAVNRYYAKILATPAYERLLHDIEAVNALEQSFNEIQSNLTCKRCGKLKS